MSRNEFSNHWFRQVPSSLYIWAEFCAAIQLEIEAVLSSGQTGHATVYLPDHIRPECSCEEDDPYHMRLSFSFFEDEAKVSWSGQTVSADSFSVNKDLSWTRSLEEVTSVRELSTEFEAWLDQQESWSGKLAVLSTAIAKPWLANPPATNSGMAFEILGQWAD